MKLTRRQRLHRCYCHQELDRPAVYSRAGFPGGDETYQPLRDYLREHAELKSIWNTWEIQDWPPLHRSTEPVNQDWQRVQEVLETPAGPLRSTRLVSLRGLPGMDETYLARTAEDVHKYLSLPPAQAGGDVAGFFKADEAIGDAGIADVFLGTNPAGVAAEVLGSENLALFTAIERDLVHAICQRRMETLLETVKYLLSKGVGPYFSMQGEEYMVPPLHGPADFADFNMRYDRPIIDAIHDGGGRIHVHSHGRIGRVLPMFVEMGVDVLHPFEGPPMGDCIPAQAKAVARGRMCLEGNIQIHRMYEATADEVRQETQNLIRDCFDDRRGLIVSPTASPYIRGAGHACFPQYKAMIDAVLDQ